MRRWIPSCAGLLLGCAVAGAETRINAVAQGGAGGIWGIALEEEGRVLLRRDDAWEPRPVTGVEKLRAHAIEPTANGGVVCLWASPHGAQGALTRHRGVEDSEVALFDTKLNQPRLLVCADGRVVVTERGPTVVTLDAEWKKALVRKLPDNLFRAATKGEGKDRNYAPTCAVQDMAGRVWLWSYALDTSDFQWRLAELVLLTGDGFERFPVAGLPAGAAISDALPAGPNQLWIARPGEGLWSVDTQTKYAAPLPEARFAGVERKAFAFVERMRAIGNARYVVTSPQPSKFESVEDAPRIAGRMNLSIRHFYDQRQRTGALFRHRGGKWEKLIAGIDEHPRFGWWERPFAQNEKGLLIGAIGSGPWAIPSRADAPPVRLDWRQSFPLVDAVDFCLTPQGDLLCVSTKREIALVPSGREPRRLVRQVETLKAWHRL